MKTRTLVLVFLIILISSAEIFAIPTLQLYIENSIYDTSAETWTIKNFDFTLWILGDVGSYGTIYDVKLVSVYSHYETGTIKIIPTIANSELLPLPDDISMPSLPIQQDSGSETNPLMGDGTPLPSHGIYGEGRDWTMYAIDNFNLIDSPIGDYYNSTPSYFSSIGQINAYRIKVSGYTWVHFDAFDHTVSAKKKVKYIFAPFSHDVEDDGNSLPGVPEPNTIFLLGIGLIGLRIIKKYS